MAETESGKRVPLEEYSNRGPRFLFLVLGAYKQNMYKEVQYKRYNKYARNNETENVNSYF